ncbi:MAG TPA: beta-propeller fold lactonase family protein [Bacteroidales bacterium]|jgi:YVTN family beta-propeller protein|nr:beta-propeller fold lactonase family protein [Bacteroidales bacterium]HNY52435.1 beta-propeller fold lactonase family protein [Bacteroidales bacterium]HOG56218.1 beta-propeller fold lactonase family protein [Bacteroidales bacterium]HPB14045.1 beta-propeller fold lactonase family protein [Bacteroidales bacterium]HPV16077.1 beta-propeller fold lactonase family protein [Bacteroidales bacterium]
MKKTVLIMMLAGIAISISAQISGDLSSRRVALPNGWYLSPVGKVLQLGDLPLNIAVSPNGKLAAVTNNGQSTQMIHLVDVKKETVTDSVIIGKSWLGLVFSDNGKELYASGGNDNWIIKYKVRRKKLINADTIRIGKPWPEKISIAGLALDGRKKVIYAVTKENNMLYCIDLVTKSILSQTPLGGEGYTCILSPDRKTLYASCWGCDKVVIFDTYSRTIRGSIDVGDNPNDMCITRDGIWLFVANANDNNVSVIDTRAGRVIETLNAALYPDAPSGSTTNGLALSSDQKTLYIANADNNCLAVFDVSVPGRSKGKGFIPTGWYPTCVRVSGEKILVANGKGMTSLPNPYGPNPTRSGDVVIHHEGGRDQVIKVQYIGGGLFRGTMSIINVPDEKTAGAYSKAVYENTPYSKENELIAEGEEGNPIPRKVGDPSPIKYVFYVIKENRTYDQVFGDMPEGNGDPDLVLFGENVTPNHHAIAREFVLLDNFYVNGEVSADGHNWTMGAYATDYLEKNWPTSYGGRGGSYPGEGAREVANNKVFFWDLCKQHGVSYRTYGEFVSGGKPTLEVLKDNYCPYFTEWDESVRDTVRFYQWKRDFDSLLAINAVPQFNTIRFINDHTQGLSLGKPTPFAHVADNDLALGLFVEYLSHSPIWNETLIISVEDDAQNGPDHVDAHRSIALLAGGFVKQGFVDHTPYTTTSLLRTMELVLGLPPMTQYDAAANSLWRCFNTTPGHPPYKCRPANIDLNEKNTDKNKWQALSETFDFSVEDRVNDFDFNEVIWRAVKGLDSPCPPSVRAAFLTTEAED